jgi:hypothetical protein
MFFPKFLSCVNSCVYSAKLFPFIQRNYFRLFTLFPIQRNYFVYSATLFRLFSASGVEFRTGTLFVSVRACGKRRRMKLGCMALVLNGCKLLENKSLSLSSAAVSIKSQKSYRTKPGEYHRYRIIVNPLRFR